MLRWLGGVAWLFLALLASVEGQIKDTTVPVEAEVELCANLRAANKTVDLSCGTKWGIMNSVVVLEYWEVHEMEMFWDTDCTLPLPKGVPISSQVMTTMLEHEADMAWDGNLETRFTSNCRILLGGCSPYTVYVGKNIGSSIPLNREPVETWGQVRCVRLFQSENTTRQASSVSVVTWENQSEDSFHVIYTYSDLSGGAWHTRPAVEEALWRIWNLVPTDRPWQVAEIMFFTDVFCEENRQAKGQPISTGSFFPEGVNDFGQAICINKKTCDTYKDRNAFDGVKTAGMLLPNPLPTKWIASCHEFDGCATRQASIGLDFDRLPRQIRCVRMYQPLHEGYPKWGYPHYASQVLLQSWNGYRWEDRTAFTGLEQGNWTDTAPKPYCSWRLANYDRIPYTWQVFGLKMWSSEDCSGSELQGEAVDSNPALLSSAQIEACWSTVGSCSKLAFDLDDNSAWESSCSPCDQRAAWVGLRFGLAQEVKCFKILQSENVDHRSDGIELSVWMGYYWENRRFEAGVGGGTWNRRPTAEYTAWRFVSTRDTEMPWAVTGIAFYEDSICNQPVLGNLITSGNTRENPIAYAFDEDLETEWVASCVAPFPDHPGCMMSTEWIGQQSTKPFYLKCLRLYQSRDRMRQTSSAVMQVWEGQTWIGSPDHPVFNELGGGAWQMLPGFRGSMWRVLADPAPGGDGVAVTELEFFRNADCTGALPQSMPNVIPICSGYATAKEVGKKTGYTNHYVHMGELSSAKPTMAFDYALNTFWADIGGQQTWLGLDFSTQVTDVQCLKIAFAGIRSMQPVVAEIQGWSGSTWREVSSTSSISTDSLLQLPLPSLGGAGFTRRPAPEKSIWRLQNVINVRTWIMYEVEFYYDLGCRGNPLTGSAIGSAKDAIMSDSSSGHAIPALAFDADHTTSWEADCPGDNCQPGTAWIGLDMMGEQHEVRCFRIIQSGRRDAQVSEINLAAWVGSEFEVKVTYNGLGGNSWNQRPAPPDTMWRVAYAERDDQECPGVPPQKYIRSWGVTEIEFFNDDACTGKLPGPEDNVDVICSGTREVGMAPLSGTGPQLAFDGKMTTTWSAQCGSSGKPNEDVDCRPGVEWIGLDFNRRFSGVPVEVRCMKVSQSRSTGSECCDPAKTLNLERWNGTHWVLAVWKHITDENVVQNINGPFTNMAPCADLEPEVEDAVIRGEASTNLVTGVFTQKRNRRENEACIIPSPGSIKLLSDSFCDKHSTCREAGFKGYCCPVDESPGAATMSRCCCKFNLAPARVFSDEMDIDQNRETISNAPEVGVEMIAVRAAQVMPIIGLVMSILFFAAYAVPKPDAGPNGELTFALRMWYRWCGPTHRFLNSGSMLASGIHLLIKRTPMDKPSTLIAKRLLFCVIGFLFGSMSIYWLFAYFVAESILKAILFFSFFIKWSKSHYDPSDAADVRRLCDVLGIPLPGQEERVYGLRIPEAGGVLMGFASWIGLGIFTLFTMLFDVVLVRYAFMGIKAVDLLVSPMDILKQIPNPGVDVSETASMMYYLVELFEMIYMTAILSAFGGAPRCEGPVVIISAIFLLVITQILVRWLNYDYFGLLRAAQTTTNKTRPMFQKTIAVATTAGVQSGIYIGMQCLMLISGRAMKLVKVDPFTEDPQWTCPYPGEFFSVFTGRLFLLLSAFMTLVTAFLCANGHFMGQDYILEPFGKKLDLDLAKLDPDGGGEGGGFMRVSTFLSIIPTTLGVWIDGWNVEGYLVKERGQVYAEELKMPEVCPECGFAHIPYINLMAATGKQLSLSYQLLPFGAVIGKACEYFNNPPLLYIGTELKCLVISPSVEAVNSAKGRKMAPIQALIWNTQLLLAYVKDWIAPLVVRIGTIGTYYAMVYYLSQIDRENVKDVGGEMWMQILYFIIAKFGTWMFLPVASLFLIGLLFKVDPSRETPTPEKEAKPFHYRPVIGQVIHGTTLGFGMAVWLFKDSKLGFSITMCVVLGAAVGAGESILAVIYCYALELCPNCDLSGGLCKITFGLVVAVFSARLCTLNMVPVFFYLMMSVMALSVIPATNLGFKASPWGLDGNQAPSSLWPLLSSARVMSGPFGVGCGVFASAGPYASLTSAFPWLYRDQTLMTVIVPGCLFLGYLFGTMYAAASDTLCTKRAGKWAMLVGTLVVGACGLLVHWAIGLPAGLIVGICTGAAVEQRQMQEADRRNYEPPRYTKAALNVAAPSMGSVSNAVGYMQDDKHGFVDVQTNLPTVTKALTPGLDKPGAITEGTYGDAYAQWQAENMQFYPEEQTGAPLALAGDPYDDPNNFAVVEAHAQSTGSWHSYGDNGHDQGAYQDHALSRSRSPGRKTPKSPSKKHTLGALAKNTKVQSDIAPPGPRDASQEGGGQLIKAAGMAAAASRKSGSASNNRRS